MDNIEEENKELSFLEQRKPHEYNPTKKMCTLCGHYPLEEETRGWEKVTFCTNCDYVSTQSM